MTKDSIIETAFRVWGRDFYRNPSLSSLAKELKVSKPALYRHFLSKEALTNAMQERFFNNFAASIRPGLEKAAQTDDADKGLYYIIEAFGGYFARNCYDLIFSLMNIYDRKLDSGAASGQIMERGANLRVIRKVLEKKYDIHPSLIPLIFATLTFYIADFNKKNDAMNKAPKEDQINSAISSIYNLILQGFAFSPEQVNALNFDKLEKLDESQIHSEKPDAKNPMNALFKAVAEAVAEAGPWAASMEMVAKKMGLSKSSLYGHFKNKKDMLRRLFITEFKRIIDFARQGMGLSSDIAEKLYLGIYSVSVYLESRPEILIAIDWIRTRKLDLGKHRALNARADGADNNAEFFNLFEDLKLEETQSHWILFLLVNVLIKTEDKSKNDIRVLFRFITLGLGGFISNEK